MKPPSWLYGLQDYFDFEDDFVAKLFVDQLISVYFSDNKANSVKNLCLADSGDPNEKLPRFNFYFKLLDEKPIDFVETVSIMRKRLTDVPLLDYFHKYGRRGYNQKFLEDAFSRGQVSSKIWLAKELKKISNKYDNILLCAGWMGQATLYFDACGIEYDNIRNIDLDVDACDISDHIFNMDKIEGWRMVASNSDINDLVHYNDHCVVPLVTGDGRNIDTRFEPDLIVNTSSEHMDESWFYNIKIDAIVAIQSNNLLDVKEHVNCVTSIDAMKKKFKLSEILYEGEIQLPGYKRFMLIGRK